MEKTENEIIAEFMKNDAVNSPHLRTAKELEGTYECSWDWLMPVVEKIYDLRLGKYNSQGNLLREPIGYAIEDFSLTPQSRKDNTHKAVIEFIKWYSTQPKQNGN